MFAWMYFKWKDAIISCGDPFGRHTCYCDVNGAWSYGITTIWNSDVNIVSRLRVTEQTIGQDNFARVSNYNSNKNNMLLNNNL